MKKVGEVLLHSWYFLNFLDVPLADSGQMWDNPSIIKQNITNAEIETVPHEAIEIMFRKKEWISHFAERLDNSVISSYLPFLRDPSSYK
ncbi:hypothetical protein WAI453_004670 [Rhynchosporium graminicola]